MYSIVYFPPCCTCILIGMCYIERIAKKGNFRES